MVIDCHQHVFWKGRDDAWLVGEMDRLGIDIAWLITWYLPRDEDDFVYHQCTNPLHARPDGTHAAMPLDDIITAVHHYPDRFIPGFCPPPTRADAPDLFEAAYHMHGVRICAEWSYRTLLDDPRAIQLFRKAGELKCPVLLHMDVPYLSGAYNARWYGGTVANLERAMQACPETVFIGHAPGFWREISGDADADPAIYPTGPIKPGGRLFRLFAEYPLLHADLSAGSALGALQRDVGHAREFLIRYADRLLFGRDDYGNALNEFLQSLDLPRDVQDKIYRGNAMRLVPLERTRLSQTICPAS